MYTYERIVMKNEHISDILIYENIKVYDEKKYQPLQLEIPQYEEVSIPINKEEVKEPRRVIIIDL